MQSVNYPFEIDEGVGMTAMEGDFVESIPYNDLDRSIKLLDSVKDDLACVILEPILGGGGCIPADINYLRGSLQWDQVGIDGSQICMHRLQRRMLLNLVLRTPLNWFRILSINSIQDLSTIQSAYLKKGTLILKLGKEKQVALFVIPFLLKGHHTYY